MSHSILANAPTQARHPWRAVIRTVFALVVGLAPMVPGLLAASGIDQAAGWGLGAITVSAAVTRILASPAVNAFLALYVPWLAAEAPRPVGAAN